MKNIRIKANTKRGYQECCEGGVFDANYPSSKNRRGRVQEGGNVTPALTANYGNLVLIDKIMEKTKIQKTPRPEGKGWCWNDKDGKWFRIRKLTPRECFRLMDVDENYIDKLIVEYVDEKGQTKHIISNSQLYKLAGNSIVVNCMYLMFINLFFPDAAEAGREEEPIQLTLF